MKLVCNGLENCNDGSDESNDICNEFPCPMESFRCTIGGCVSLKARCDGVRHCLDGSDEENSFCKLLKCTGMNCDHCKLTKYI